MELLEDLNERQREAVVHTEGPLLVIAGAGSGKTRVLMYRIAYLVRHKGVDPRHILAVTFTNKAADEMKARAARLLGEECKGIWLGTFHASCARILREHGERVGLRRNFVICDEADQLSHIKACMKELDSSRMGIAPQAVRAVIEKAKNNALSYEDVLSPGSPTYAHMLLLLRRYEERLRHSNALDFGDLINDARLLLETHPDVRAAYRRRFRYVMVDEYQDTNRAQHLLLKALVPPGGNVCVVGDDDQSIYRWRGARVSNLLDFERDFPGTKVVTLEQNYRSTKTILAAANRVAMGNPLRRPKNLWTENEAGEKISYAACADPLEEARYVAERIQRLVSSGGYRLRDIGVFFRTNAQSRPFEEVFVRYRIPYALIGTLRFFERAEVKDVLAYLRILLNPDDSVSLSRIINRPPRGIGEATLRELDEYASMNRISLWHALQEGLERKILSQAATQRIGAFCGLVRSLRARLREARGLAALLQEVIEATGYKEYLSSHDKEDAERRLDNIAEMVKTAEEFEHSFSSETLESKLAAFLERVALVSDADTYNGKADCVSLMTLHCAKGLEFPVVFLAGFEEGIIPHERSSLSEEELAEERRLCYVGMTRAMKKLYLTGVAERSYFGQPRFMEPSSFLYEIPNDLIEYGHRAGRPGMGRFSAGDRDERCEGIPPATEHGKGTLGRKPRAARAEGSFRFKVGDLVHHTEFGQGIIRRVEGRGEKEKVTVQFSTAGIRKLIVAYAPLTKLC